MEIPERVRAACITVDCIAAMFFQRILRSVKRDENDHICMLCGEGRSDILHPRVVRRLQIRNAEQGYRVKRGDMRD